MKPTHKRTAVCPQCMQGHPVMDYPEDWQNAVRDHVGHITRGDVSDKDGLGMDSYTFAVGYKFAQLVDASRAKGWDAHVVEQEMHEQQVYWRVIKGYDAYFAEKNGTK